MTDNIRTDKGTYLSFDRHPDGTFTLNILSSSKSVHVELSAHNLEEFADLASRTYYDADLEDFDVYLKRIVKEAIAEERHEEIQNRARIDRALLERAQHMVGGML